eukprot:TRINITY_DN44_c0_g1_i9.p1 TRINITY_DN44_c0_g1~~TRINITY_DN44_c0_g1_i9.p1  ORF type:complete len:320 (+),score=101.19 TRINITY_DN44_c0_g1_i9:50-1009(+)
MAKVLPFVVGSGKTAAADVVGKVLSAVGVSLKQVTVDGAVEAAKGNGGVALAGGLTKCDLKTLGAHSSVIETAPSASINPDATYSDAAFTVVRSRISNPTGSVIPPSERLDKFAKLGINLESEKATVTADAKQTAAVACDLAQEKGQTKIVVLQKQQSAFKAINDTFLAAVKEVATERGVSIEIQTSQEVANNAVMFSKTLGVVVTPDYEASDVFCGVATGVSGGVGMATVAHSAADATFFGAPNQCGSSPAGFSPHTNPTGLLLGAAAALNKMGMAAESSKVSAAIQKTYASGKSLPSDVKGGSADAAAFAAAVASVI